MIDDDISKIQYKLAKCCNPIKGDDVFGFVTISAGITIHRCDCPNAKRMRENYPYRVIDARWRQSAEGAFRVTIRIVAADTTGMANHITETVIRDLKLNIRSPGTAAWREKWPSKCPVRPSWTRSYTRSCASRACSAPTASTNSANNFLPTQTINE